MYTVNFITINLSMKIHYNFTTKEYFKIYKLKYTY